MAVGIMDLVTAGITLMLQASEEASAGGRKRQ